MTEISTYADFMKSAPSHLFTVGNLWILIAGALVFLMHPGFAMLETGLVRAKNAVNILYKNSWILCAGVITYALWGFNTMYPGSFNGFLKFGGMIGFTDRLANLTSVYADYTYWADFFFQAMFCATAATIVSGAVAERIKLTSFMIYSTFLVGLIYPIAGAWKWGGGWLDTIGFYDFAGSGVVHEVGGFAALAGCMVLGARKGKYTEDGDINTIQGHSMPLAIIGKFLLVFGWFGFNGGSVLSADPAAVSLVFTTTILGAVTGGVGAMIATLIFLRRHDLVMFVNGFLGGLVSITASADGLTPGNAMWAGLIGGLLVVCSVILIDRVGIDDVVGAISVHGVCGAWGLLVVSLFTDKATLLPQLTGLVTYALFPFAVSYAIFWLLKKTIGLRVSEKEEEEGLDMGEHGQHAYPYFNGK